MNFDFQKMNDSNAGRYVFGITGQIKEIIYPSKAILGFKYNGKEEKAKHDHFRPACDIEKVGGKNKFLIEYPLNRFDS